MFHSSTIELSESALKKNVRFLKRMIGPKVKFSSVVKGNAYGHGIRTFVPLAEKCGVRHFSVASADEALQAHQVRSLNSEIMIMSYISNDELEWAIINQVSFYVFELDRLEMAIKTAKKLKMPARIHLEIETGMYRTGLEGTYLDQAVQMIQDNEDHVVVEGICTHYAGAESVRNYLRVQNQIKRFNETYDHLTQQGLTIKYRHTACSAAAITYPETHMDMVRFGIAHYGFWPTEETKMHYYMENNLIDQSRSRNKLARVISWRSCVMTIKDVPPGEFIGYGTSYLTTRKQRIASIPVGYSHGFSRSLSNLGRVLIHGRRVPVVGLVNMNMMLVDVTNLPQVRKGDEVVMIGKQKKLQMSVSSFSDLTRYLNYEVLVSLPAEIPRVVVK